ncbi:MAG: hypothetical protein QG596_1918 [Actinomycetota bacterium]|nr:hypothetical protein [Actinomycetota bacterium]
MAFNEQSVQARKALLDVAEALDGHLESLVLVGAQAIYLYTGDADVAVATATKDSDIAVIPDLLGSDPTLEKAMEQAGFKPALAGQQGKWFSPEGIPVDLIAPEGLQGPAARGRRGIRMPPHSQQSARTTPGLEGIAVDSREMEIRSLVAEDPRSVTMKVAGPSTLVVAKTFKICERIDSADRGNVNKVFEKDAHDLYRLLQAVPMLEIVDGFKALLEDKVAAAGARWSLDELRRHGSEPDFRIPVLAGRTEVGVGDPEIVSVATAALVRELLAEVPS